MLKLLILFSLSIAFSLNAQDDCRNFQEYACGDFKEFQEMRKNAQHNLVEIIDQAAQQTGETSLVSFILKYLTKYKITFKKDVTNEKAVKN